MKKLFFNSCFFAFLIIPFSFTALNNSAVAGQGSSCLLSANGKVIKDVSSSVDPNNVSSSANSPRHLYSSLCEDALRRATMLINKLPLSICEGSSQTARGTYSWDGKEYTTLFFRTIDYTWIERNTARCSFN